jgi:hypothetical protein
VNRDIGRRQVLAAAAAAVVAPAGARIVARHLRADGTTAAATTDDAIARIGRAYLRLVPREANEAKLVAALPAGFSATGSDWSALQDRITADYAAGRVVAIDGWRLSRTSARAAALSVLQSR